MRFEPCGSLRTLALLTSLAAAAVLTIGCASPATPRPPSLQLPQPVRDLTAARSGDKVDLTFTIPARTTDGVAIRSTALTGVLCRQDDKASPCRAVDEEHTAAPLPMPPIGAPAPTILWTDTLPGALTAGPPRVVSYRVELRNAAGRSAGYSDPAYVAAGNAPPPVDAFTADGVRQGVLLQWHPEPQSAGQLLVRRQRLDPVPGPASARVNHKSTSASQKKSSKTPTPLRGTPVAKNSPAKSTSDETIVWLKTPDEAAGVPRMIDGTIEEGVRYRYTAFRSRSERIGGRTIEIRSAPSTPAELAWRDIYPPPTPQGLTALGYTSPPDEAAASHATYAVDLVWQPVNDPRVTGYVVARQQLDNAGQALGSPIRLTTEPITTPGFHDATAIAGANYRYEVTAVGAKGNASAPATATAQVPTS